MRSLRPILLLEQKIRDLYKWTFAASNRRRAANKCKPDVDIRWYWTVFVLSITVAWPIPSAYWRVHNEVPSNT